MVSKEEKQRILDAHHKAEKKSVKITLFFMFLIVLGAVLILVGTGILDSKSADTLGRADIICFLSGYPNGVNTDSIQRNATSYVFECDQDRNVTIGFDKETGKGTIDWKK